MSGGPPGAWTAAADAAVIYVLCPLLVALIIATVTWLVHLSKRLSRAETGLALLIREVTPPGEPSLRSMVADARQDVAVVRARVR